MTEIFDFTENINYEGPDSKNPLAFKHYDPEKIIGNKKMSEHLRFSVAYWHTMTEKGTDPFGNPTMVRPWDKYSDPLDKAKAKVEAGFEFMNKLGVEYFCFHDIDVAPDGSNLRETNKNLDIIVNLIEEYMEETGIKLLWGTTNLFSHPRFMHGAASSPYADIFAYGAAKVKKAMEVTKRLGGQNYVFWGGREGYETLLNTDMALEQDNLARFFQMAVDYKKEIGFEGQFLLEPKPKEPTKHQYDFDAANVIAFLRGYGLDDHFKLNLEANHATLAGHTFQHELRYARINDMLGSVDANQGDLLLGWDTDQFPSNLYTATLAMYEVLKNGGIEPGGLNFDAKVRRPSHTLKDLFHGHILGMDTYARGLEVAHSLLDSGELEEFIASRYSSYQSGIGSKIVKGEVGFTELEDYIIDKKEKDIIVDSGQQERLETILNRHLLQV